MKIPAITGLLLVLLGACATDDASWVNPNLMTDQEIIAYNQSRRIWDQIVCTRGFGIRSHIKKRTCGTLSDLNRRAAATGEQLNIVSFGTPQIYH